MAGETRNWPGDGEFVAALMGSNFYGLKSARQRVFFTGIENHLRDDKAEDTNPVRARWEYLNIEHVMPQNWKANWPLADGSDQGLVARREQASNSVGNLTLTNGRLNSQMRDKAWPSKKAALQQKSTLLITTASILAAPPDVDGEDAAAWPSEWDETRITKRRAYLVGTALEVWRRPEITPTAEYGDDLHRPRCWRASRVIARQI
ncbi:HNH endonuclease family protein [Gordonia sp. 852002-51296_SCH5728562-b]|uniref:HNH endonuclease family protein n=1 Tax=Gordonia sp. 852002-51296_SCH5728562-b TaxID=1834101 RepID=UPI0007E940EE|nr:HNH endonuclease family protein [Gordonia sp. 852002-51296_SCH5728562-b]OBA40763.1 hypothetical protein A5766_01865 [Gordonia sp. 852002-51296_SCH5728562-b]